MPRLPDASNIKRNGQDAVRVMARGVQVWPINPTPTPTPTPTITQTSLTVTPSGTAASGSTITLRATLTPSAASGTIQFRRGSIAIGSSVSITNGVATTTTSSLTVGTHSLSAQFSPSDPAAYTGSTSQSISYTITGSGGTVDPDLPELGFSLNGSSLSGPLSQAHYNNLSSLSAGSVWARVGFSSDGDWQSNVDTYVGAARQAGMKILLRASFPNAVYSGSQPLNSTAQAAYGNFVRDLATYVKNTHGLGPSDVVFEHPNEMNGRVSGANYTAAAANAYPKLKSVNPNYMIIGASENVYASNWQTWLQDVYAAGYASAADGVSFHNYDPQNNRAKYTFLENLMKEYGHWPAMVWLTEFGATTPPGATGNGSAGAGNGGQTEQGQATRIVGVLEYLRDSLPWITHAFVYADEDIPSRKTSDPFEAYFGIYRNDSNGTITGAKPAVDAIRQLYN